VSNWALTQTAAPATEPVSISEAKKHCRVDYVADDSYINDLVAVARRRVESMTGRQLVTATYELRMDEWYEMILLPRPPVQSVTKIEYVDGDGTTTTVSSGTYNTDTDSETGRITEAHGEAWPTARDVVNAVTVTYDAGYGGSASDVPADIRHAMKLLIGHYYEQREQVTVRGVPREIPRGVSALLSPYKVTDYGDVYPGVNEEVLA